MKDHFEQHDSSEGAVRLQKFIADAGICSRRSAEAMIAQGEVWVNGRMAILGTKVSPGVDKVTVSGKIVRTLKAVARLKTLGRSSDIDSLIANAGTPAANKKLARFLETQAYPQFGASPKDPGKIEIYVGDPGKRPGTKTIIH